MEPAAAVLEDEMLEKGVQQELLLPEQSLEETASLSGWARLVVLATAFVDILGFSMPNPIMPFYYTSLQVGSGHEGVFLGLIMASFSLGQFFGAMAAGAASDKIGRRIPILSCLVGNSLCLVATAMAPSIWGLIAARGLAGLFAGTQSVCAAYVCDFTHDSERVRELSYLQTAVSVGFLAGPALGIAIGWSFGPERIVVAFQLVCLTAAGIAAAAFVAGLFFLKDADARRKPSGKDAAVLVSGNTWSIVWGLLRRRDVVLVLGAQFVTQLVGTIMEVALPALLVTAAHAPIWQVLVVFATLALAVPVVLGLVYPFLSNRWGNVPTMVAGLVCNASGMIIIPVVVLWYFITPTTLLVALGSMIDPALQVIVSFNAGHAFGTAMGMLRSTGAAARIVGPVIGGSLFDVPFGILSCNATCETVNLSCLPCEMTIHLLPFWVGAVGSLGAVLLVLLMKNTDHDTASRHGEGNLVDGKFYPKTVQVKLEENEDTLTL